MAPKLDDFMQWPEIEALEYGECSRPQDVLGARMAVCFSGCATVSVNAAIWGFYSIIL